MVVREKEGLSVLQRETEASLLKQQLHPHASPAGLCKAGSPCSLRAVWHWVTSLLIWS